MGKIFIKYYKAFVLFGVLAGLVYMTYILWHKFLLLSSAGVDPGFRVKELKRLSYEIPVLIPIVLGSIYFWKTAENKLVAVAFLIFGTVISLNLINYFVTSDHFASGLLLISTVHPLSILISGYLLFRCFKRD